VKKFENRGRSGAEKKFPALKILALAAAAVCTFTAVMLSCLVNVVSLDFSAVFYYVVYGSPTDEVSAASVSSLVHSYGGAGYIIECDGEYFVTVSCYFDKAQADEVCSDLNSSGISCAVIAASADGYGLKLRDAQYKAKYEGNLNTLLSLSKICYGLANSLDDLSVSQNGAKNMLTDVSYSLSGLLKSNAENCFTEQLNYLICECEDVSTGYVFSYDVRKLQIAICNALVNIKIY